MSDALYHIALALPGIVSLIAIVAGVVYEKHKGSEGSALNMSRVGMALVLLGIMLPSVILLATQLDLYVFLAREARESWLWTRQLPIHVDGFGLVSRMVAAFIVLLFFRSLRDPAPDSNALSSTGVFSRLFGLAFGFFLITGSGDVLIIWAGLEVMLFSVKRFPAAGIAGNEQNSLGGFYAGLALFGIVLFYGMFGTTDLSGIQSALSTRNVEIVPLNPVLWGMILLLAGFVTRVGSGVAGILGNTSHPVSIRSGLLVLMLLLAGSVVALRFFAEMLPPYLFGLNLADIVMAAGVSIGVVCGLLAIGTDDRIKALCYAMGGHTGMVLLGIVSGGGDGLFGPRSWLIVNVLFTLGLMMGVVRLHNDVERRSTLSSSVAGFMTMKARIRDLWMLFLFCGLAGLPFAGGFLARVVLFGTDLVSPGGLQIIPGSQRFSYWNQMQSAGLHNSELFLVMAGLLVAVLLLYAYGRLFAGVYFSGAEYQGNRNLKG